MPSSALKYVPQMRSSQVVDAGTLSATLAHPINSQSAAHVPGPPCEAPPTTAPVNVAAFPEIVNDWVRLLTRMNLIRNNLRICFHFTHSNPDMIDTVYYKNFAPFAHTRCSPDLKVADLCSCRSWNYEFDHKHRCDTVNIPDPLWRCWCMQFERRECATNVPAIFRMWWL